MADVLPFAGTRFNTKENKADLSTVISPPFDVVSPEMRKELHERGEFNMVRLTTGFESATDDEFNNRYTRASECYKEWKMRNVLVDEQRKCFYLYEHQFKLPGSKKVYTRTGFFALVKLQDYRSGKIRAHEMTYEGPKRDRLNLLKACQVNLEPLFILYQDPTHTVDKIIEEAKKNKPHEDFEDSDGDHHRVWLMHKKDPILQINQAMKKLRLYIADGHHRYETALTYRDEMREVTGRRDGRQPWDFLLMYLNNADDETLFTSSMHRVLSRELGMDVDLDEVLEDVEEFFDIKPIKIDLKNLDKAADTVEKAIEVKRGVKTAFAMVLPDGRCYILKLKKDADINEMVEEEFMSELVKSRDVTILHQFIIARGWIGNPEMELAADDIIYTREIKEAISLVRRRKGCVAFIMNPMSREEVLEIAENGELLPQNSTHFWPKVKSGFVMRDLNVGFG